MKLPNLTQRSLFSEKVIKVNSKTPIILLNDIILIEGKSNYSLIQTKSDAIICTKSLKFFEENLDNKRFIRTHKSHIVNLDYIQRHRVIEGVHTLEMKNGQLVGVSRRRSQYVELHI